MKSLQFVDVKNVGVIITCLFCCYLLIACSAGNSGHTQVQPQITSFSINGTSGVITSYGGNSATTDYNISLQLPESTDLSNLVPMFTTSNDTTAVLVNDVPNISGKTAHDFSKPLKYSVIGSSPADVTTYTVAVNYGVLTTNITESTYYSLTTGLSTNVVIHINGAFAANGRTLGSMQVYNIGGVIYQGEPSFKTIIEGRANDDPNQIPIGHSGQNLIAAILLFLPSFLNCDDPSKERDACYYYPTTVYTIPVRP